MYETILKRDILERSESLIMGDRLRISLIETKDKGLMLGFAIVSWGGVHAEYYTDSNFLAIDRKVFPNTCIKMGVELNAYFGDDCDLSLEYTKGVFERFALYNVQKVWERMGKTPTRIMTFGAFRDFLSELE